MKLQCNVTKHFYKIKFKFVWQITSTIKIIKMGFTYAPSSCQCEAVSMIAGIIRARVDILTAPSRDTTKSSQGTVAATAT